MLLCNLFEDDEKVTLSMTSKDFPESLGHEGRMTWMN